MLNKKNSKVVDYSTQPTLNSIQQYPQPQYYAPMPSQQQGDQYNPYISYQQQEQYQQYQKFQQYLPDDNRPRFQTPPPTPSYSGQPINYVPYLAPVEDTSKDKKKIIAGIIVLIVILAIISIALINVFNNNGSDENEEETSVRINSSNAIRTSYGWEILISMVAGGNPKLSDIKFEVHDKDDSRLYEAYATEAQPSKLSTNQGDIYAIPSGLGDVTDSLTENTIVRNSSLSNYQFCYMVYCDTDYNFKLTPGDKIYIYRDFDSDGNNDVLQEDIFYILLKNEKILNKPLL